MHHKQMWMLIETGPSPEDLKLREPKTIGEVEELSHGTPFPLHAI